MRATSQTSTPTPRITASSARPAGVTGGRVAGRGLELGERLAPLGQEVPFVDRVVDEIPGEDGVERPGAMHETIGIDALVGSAKRLQRRPPGIRPLVEADEDRRRPAIAAGEQRLEIGLA